MDELTAEQLGMPEVEPTGKENFFSYDGRAGKIFAISLLNLFLTIITIGIYRFWGKTRMRKYLVSCFTLDNDRFEYTGTGGELFKGFLKALPIVLVLMLPIVIFAEESAWPLLLYIPLFYLFGIAIYGAMRYRYSRTNWRGIRCILRGSVIEYANLSALRSIINLFTLGFAIPYSDIARNKYVVENSHFGSVKATYQGDAKRIYKSYLLSLLMMPVALILGSVVFSLPFMMFNIGSSGVPSFFAVVLVFLGMMGLVMFVSFGRAFYTAALMREHMRGIIAGDLRFRCDVTAWEIAKFQMVNVLILFCTLGFGFAFVVQRRMEFITYHHTIIGDLDTSEIFQGDAQGITSGEGLEDALDIDGGLF